MVKKRKMVKRRKMKVKMMKAKKKRNNFNPSFLSKHANDFTNECFNLSYTNCKISQGVAKM